MARSEKRNARRDDVVLRTSSAGYEFDERSDEWVLDGSSIIKLAFLSDSGIEEKTAIGFRRSLSRYAQELSASHCLNILGRALHFFRATGSKVFSAEALSHYRTTLDEQHIWYLGVLRGFLESWSEWRFPGIDREAIDYLDGLTIRGNEKGVAVLMNCPYSGPYTSLEHQSLLYGMASAYEEKRLSQHDYSFLLAVSMTGKRPMQMRYLKFCDLGYVDQDEMRTHYLDIPRVKRRGAATFRTELKRTPICKDLFDALSDQRSEVASWVSRTIGSVEESMQSNLPLFPHYKRLAACSQVEIASQLNTDFLHIAREAASQIRIKLNSTVVAHSERTGDRLIIGFTRLRRTFATNLANEGFGPMVIAEALDHSDTQQVSVYARPERETAKVVDAVMAPVLAPLAMAFAGTLVESERDAVRGNDPHSRVKIKTELSVGSCGSHSFCADGWKSCYVCKNFQPWLYGPHESARDELLRERQRQIDAGVSMKVISASDRTLLAITQVIQMCAARQADFGKAVGES